MDNSLGFGECKWGPRNTLMATSVATCVMEVRVAVLGPNGTGNSTVDDVLEGPVSGTGERQETDQTMKASLHRGSQIHFLFLPMEVAAVSVYTRALTGKWKEGREGGSTMESLTVACNRELSHSFLQFAQSMRKYPLLALKQTFK
jgi:ABC-type branched-subunit amino acid transport system ATPase component